MLVDDPTLMAAIRQMPPSQRAVYVLHDMLGWDAGDVAELLGWTVDCVNHAVGEGRVRLAAFGR